MLAGRTDSLTETFRDYCIRVIRFVSDSALDPHLYFEKKLAGDVSVAGNDVELARIIADLAAWFAETDPDQQRLNLFDQRLSAEGLPSWSLLLESATRDAAITIAARPLQSAAEHTVILEAISHGRLCNEDLRIAQQVLSESEYEPL